MVLVDDSLVAISDEVVTDDLAFTLLFTKRCSLASYAIVELLDCPENRLAALLESSVRTLRAGTVVDDTWETKACAGTSFTTFHLSPVASAFP
jgi:hypothetical protein